ncbi:hypothetical protein GCM10009754_52870 [Amycolatopsis minnesotensis]|uniref:Uncharacterized protein n=1 Tax=Amycolatopsis minnesotensis TaxID=337894 RepID=A0ABP5CZZ7_9PSEU
MMSVPTRSTRAAPAEDSSLREKSFPCADDGASVHVAVAGYDSSNDAHPHGLIGYVLDDRQRTDNCLRLLRWLIFGAIATGAVLALLLWLLLQLHVAAVMVGGLTSAAAAGSGWRAWRRRCKNRRRGT